MGIVGGTLGYRLLRAISCDGKSSKMDVSTYAGKSKLNELIGSDFWNAIQDQTVVDFGCGEGRGVIELAQRGARRVVGVDVREHVLERSRQLSEREGVADRCEFTTQWDDQADVIVSLDSFEHFDDPASILQVMAGMLKADGCVWESFGPTWYHPAADTCFRFSRGRTSFLPRRHRFAGEPISKRTGRLALARWKGD